MSNPTHSIRILERAANITHQVLNTNGIPVSPLKKPPKAVKDGKGKVIDHRSLVLPNIKSVLSKSINEFLDLKKLGLSEDELIQVLSYALRRLGKDQNRVTVSHWLGEVFEILASRHPEVVELRNDVLKEAAELVNLNLSKQTNAFVDYKNELQTLKDKKIKLENTRFIRSLWISGKKYCDGAVIAEAMDGFFILLVTEEYKTQGVKLSKLDEQQANRNPRISDTQHTENTKLTFINYSTQKYEDIDLHKVLLNPENPTGRIGVKNASRPGLDIRFPRVKREVSMYYRRGIELQTRGIRAVLQRVFNQM